MTSTGKIVFATLAIMALVCFASAFGVVLALPISKDSAFLCGTLFGICALNRL